ncbi:MAG: hypothetical protein QF793_04260, partial [Candidatus Peribacteraceae bacterium]|nr:hypothetical protein [Candidatus Peribacteraceae bacterium]
MSHEQPSQAPQETPSFEDARTHFHTILGKQGNDIPDFITDDAAAKRQAGITENYKFDTISELLEYNALKLERNRTRIHNEHAKQGQENLTQAERSEAIVVNQAEAYHIYLDNALHQVSEVMDMYHARKRSAHPSSLRELAEMETQSAIYLQTLSGAMEERTAFSNVGLALGILADVSLPAAERERAQQSLEAATAHPALSQESKRILGTRDPDAIKRQMNILNQRIIDILAGKANIEDVDDGFLPQHMYLKLLHLEYKKTLEDQLELVRRNRIKEALIQDIEERADNDTLPEQLHQLYEDTQRYLTSQRQRIEEKGAQRREITEEILAVTDYLADYQIETLELVTMQRMFGKIRDPDAEGSIRDTSPANVRDAIAQNMEERKEFHLERLERFANAIDEDVLKITFLDRVEDFNNKNIREWMLSLSQGIAKLISGPLPGPLEQQMYEFLAGELDDAMGIPLDDNGDIKPRDQWTEEELQAFQEKMQSIKDIVGQFDRTKLECMQETITLLRKMPSATNFLDQEVTRPLPAGRVTAEEVDRVVADPTNPDNKGAEILARLMAQLEGDVGDPDAENPTGVLGESREFLEKVDENIDTHIDIGRALQQQGKNYWKLALIILGAAAAGYTLPKVARRVRFSTPSSRIARGLNRNPGYKLVEFADDAERSLGAIRGLQAERLFKEGRDVAALRRAIEEAHAIRPTGVGGTWTRADIAGKWRVLKNAGLETAEIRYLLENGWCGRSADDVATLLARNSRSVPEALRFGAQSADDLALRVAAQRGLTLEQRLA